MKQSAKKKSILELEVPEKETGIFFYDSYWKMVMGDHTNRANPDVLKVIENIMITLNGLYIR